MDNLVNHLVELSNRLDKEGKQNCADAVDNLIREGSVTKIAQYVGVIGYVLKQNRAMENCVRRKRSSSDTSMQEVVMSCLKEYQDGQDYNDKEWTSKYAQVVQHNPSLFNQAHLVFLAELGKESNIETHITNIEKAAALLEENGKSDDTLGKMLSHIKSYGDILREETSVNFKVAAPRGWWSRLWQNVNPWSKTNRERGENKKTTTEMNNILERIIEVGDTTRQMKHGIRQLRSQFGSLSGMMTKGSPSQDIATRVNRISLDNWESLNSSVYQIQHLIQNTQTTTSQEQQLMSSAANLVDGLSNDVSSVNDSIRDLQINMNMLRQRTSVKGRYSKYTDEGTEDYRAISSPAEEFGVLDRVLSRLYKNPFDQEAHFYAQRMHARLDDKLRYIESEPDQAAQDWLQTPETETETPTGELTTQTGNAIDVGPVDDRQVNAVVQSVLNMPTLSESADVQDKAKWLTDLFTKVFATFKLRDHPKLKALKETLEQVSRNPAHTSTPMGPATTSTSLQDAAPSPESEAAGNNELNFQDWSRQMVNFGDDDDPFDPTKRGSINDLIKIATEIDSIDRNLADLIDKYIEEKDLFELPEFPGYASVVKVDDEEQSNTDKEAGYAFSVS